MLLLFFWVFVTVVPTLAGSKKALVTVHTRNVARMDNVLIVVDDLEETKAFFIELGLTLEGETPVEGPAVGRLIGLEDVCAILAMMRTPDGQGVELDKFHTPSAIRFGPVDAPVRLAW
ncbi:MAG TPA: hypothetical protein VN628_19185 [Vicinamibacterales bacterium]|nr:hypothetical protein [Vicinamibacterales bacterium]